MTDKGRNVLFHCTLYSLWTDTDGICSRVLCSKKFPTQRQTIPEGQLCLCALPYLRNSIGDVTIPLSVTFVPRVPIFKSSSFLFSHFSVWNQGHELSVLFLRWPRRFSRKLDSSFLTHSLSKFHWMLSSELMPRYMVPTLKEAYASFLLEVASLLMAVSEITHLTRFLKRSCWSSHLRLPLPWVF